MGEEEEEEEEEEKEEEEDEELATRQHHCQDIDAGAAWSPGGALRALSRKNCFSFADDLAWRHTHVHEVMR